MKKTKQQKRQVSSVVGSLFLDGEVTAPRDTEDGATYRLLGVLLGSPGTVLVEQPDVYISENTRLEEWTTQIHILEIGVGEDSASGKPHWHEHKFESIGFSDYIEAFNRRDDKEHQLQEFVSSGHYYAVTYRDDESTEFEILRAPM